MTIRCWRDNRFFLNKKKKQHYRYSQSRWNTYIVVSSTSKIRFFDKKVKLILADLWAKFLMFSFKSRVESRRGGRSSTFNHILKLNKLDSHHKIFMSGECAAHVQGHKNL